MKYVGKNSIKKLCNFYVSELHLSVMLLPYISKQLNEDVEITTIFEKFEKSNIEAILDKLNVKNKEKILNINWFNNKETYDKIKRIINNKDKKVTIIIGGNEEFVLENNKKIIKMLEQENINMSRVTLINCFNLEELKLDMNSIIVNYDGILNTAGENIF